MFETLLFAQDASPTASAFTGFMPLILIFIIFYFLLIRPQQKQAKELRKMLAALKKGDRVATSGGVIGTIVSLGETEIVIKISDNCNANFTRSSVTAILKK